MLKLKERKQFIFRPVVAIVLSILLNALTLELGRPLYILGTLILLIGSIVFIYRTVRVTKVVFAFFFVVSFCFLVFLSWATVWYTLTGALLCAISALYFLYLVFHQVYMLVKESKVETSN